MFRTFFHGLVLVLALAAALPAAAQEVNVYSYRKAHLIEPLLEAFTARTGIAVRLVTGKADALLERLKSEGLNSPADVLLTVDAGRLIRAKAAGVLQPVRSAVLERLVPARFRDPEGAWFGLSLRARVIFHARNRVRPGELSTYEDLADPKWRGRLCIRSSGNVYNQSLLASLIEHDGAAEAEAWAKGVVANLARKPQGGDRDQIKAVAAGECDVTVANTYYYAGMLASKREDQRAAAAKVALFWPNQKGRGAHVNISGAGVTRSARNRDNAIALIEFLASGAAQLIYAKVVNEYPIREGVAIANGVASLGAFKADAIDLAVFAQHQAQAMRVFDRAGWR